MSRKEKRKSALRLPLVEALKDLPWFEVDGIPPGKAQKFSLVLQTPIVESLSKQPVVDGVAHIDGVINSILSQRIEKLISLLKHYKLEASADPWLLLSLRLACAFVPGFRVVTKTPRGRGRPKGAKRWTREARYELIAAVEAVRAEKKGRSIANSVQILKKRDPERWASLNPARYHEARRERTLYDQAVRALIRTDA
jgi:hypothetical protein